MNTDNTQGGDEPSPASAGSQLGDTESRWRSAAIRLGESLTGDGPDDYYDFTPEQWLQWARETVAIGRITDADREAIDWAETAAIVEAANATDANEAEIYWKRSATLHALLERLS
jgi:hypothetical protein